jgi:hypothetical protein
MTCLDMYRGEMGVQLQPIHNPVLEEFGWSAPLSDRFTPREKPITIAEEAGWVMGPVWTDTENLAPTGDRSRLIM